uniref:Uncharacterized protein n=1 Tax=Niallia circulans TaxID=1397 RepID=A0A941GHT4_NIACI
MFTRKKLYETDYLNLPDLLFYQHCQKTYYLNRGNYHIIDEWFYKQGISSLIFRRIYMLAFLDYVSQEDLVVHKYLKFGKGGLACKLSEFLKELEFRS